ETARAAAEGAADAQEPLPDAEPLVAAERLELCVVDVAVKERAEDPDDGREAELLRERRAQALVEAPVLNRVGRAGIEAARAGLADAELLGELAVGLEDRVGEDDRRVAARSGLLRQQVQLEPDRAEPGLDGDVARRERAVARGLHLPDRLLGRGLERPVPVVFQEARDPVADAIHLAQHELVHVMNAGVVARAERARRDALEERDAAPDFRRDARRNLRVRRVRREGVQDRGGGGPDAVGPQPPRPRLY